MHTLVFRGMTYFDMLRGGGGEVHERKKANMAKDNH